MDLKADYELNFVRSRWHWVFPRTRDRIKRWMVLGSPIWFQKHLKTHHYKWYSENAMYYILADEIQKEIDAEIIQELKKVMNEN